MIVTPIKTHKITQQDTDLLAVLDQYILGLQENTVVAVTSKIASICEGRLVPMDNTDKDALIEQESQFYLPRETNKYHVSFTITNDNLVPTAGIDESNGDGNYILWPKDPQKSANDIRLDLKTRSNLKNLGVIITDSRTTPLRWGVTAVAIGYSGFVPLKDYAGTADLFGRPFVFEKMSIMDNLASAASLVMGEGSEQTPLAVITDIPNIEFQDHNPTEEELAALKISKEDDLYGPFLTAVEWSRGARSGFSLRGIQPEGSARKKGKKA